MRLQAKKWQKRGKGGLIFSQTASWREDRRPLQVIVRDETEDRTKDAEMTDITPIHHTDTDVSDMLRRAGLRPTRQRVSLAEILFSKGDRHISAELLHEEAVAVDVPVSLATVYNTLHQFTEAGLLREVAIEGTKTYFDTNVTDHHHFFVEGDNEVFDIPGEGVGIGSVPQAPEGMEIVRVDVVVRLRPKR